MTVFFKWIALAIIVGLISLIYKRLSSPKEKKKSEFDKTLNKADQIFDAYEKTLENVNASADEVIDRAKEAKIAKKKANEKLAKIRKYKLKDEKDQTKGDQKDE